MTAPDVGTSAPAPDAPVVPDAAPSDAPPPVAACPDCGAPAPGRFCAACGQEQRDRVHTSMRELGREGVEELLSLDAKLAVTLRTLVARPGALTVEYLAGRRTRYVRPLKLYLTLSVLYFLLLSLSGLGADDLGLRVTDTDDVADSTRRAGMEQAIRAYEDSGSALSLEGRVKLRFLRNALTPPSERDAQIGRGVAANTPKAFFLLVPFFAVLLYALFRRQRPYYAEHLVAALHVHAFAFLVVAVQQLLVLLVRLAGGNPDALDPLLLVILVALPAHVLLALRTVYGQSWPRTVAKAAVVIPVYWVAGLLSIVAVAFFAMLGG